MSIYHYRLWGTRFAIIMIFFIVLVALNIYILPGGEAFAVKLFCAAFTVAWLAFIVDSLAARIIVDEKGISQVSWLFKKKVIWSDVRNVDFGQKWVMASYMPRHVVIQYKKEGQRETSTLTLNDDIRGWRDLLADVIAYAPRRVISANVRKQFSPRDEGDKESPEVI